MTALTNFLKPIISSKKTLLISCFECSLGSDIINHPNLIHHTSLANLSYTQDDTHQEIIQYHVQENGCKQIIIVGDLRCQAIDRILNETSPTLYLRPFQKRLRKLLKRCHSNWLAKPLQKNILIEDNVTNQCRTTMEYPCCNIKVTQKKLCVLGVVINARAEWTIVFKDGMAFNSILSRN